MKQKKLFKVNPEEQKGGKRGGEEKRRRGGEDIRDGPRPAVCWSGICPERTTPHLETRLPSPPLLLLSPPSPPPLLLLLSPRPPPAVFLSSSFSSSSPPAFHIRRPPSDSSFIRTFKLNYQICVTENLQQDYY